MDVGWKFVLCCGILDFPTSPELFALEFEKSLKFAVFTLKFRYLFTKPNHILTEYI